MFKPDQPIQSSKDDILGRSSFAKSLGDAVLSYTEKESIVVGLFGEWGSGKTSIINMMLEHIENVSKEKNNEKPIIFRFNPWNFSDQNQLISLFFTQMSITLGRQDYSENIKKTGEKLETYSKLFSLLKIIPVINTIAELLENSGDALKSLGDIKSHDLDSLKEELNELLSKQKQKILIIIDDIDRLNNTEIRQIFQLVKSLGDFPNTIYLLSFDKEVVIKALEKVQEGSGTAYLEKVVQIPFEIPAISEQDVNHLLLKELNELLRDFPENRFDEKHWNHVFHGGFKYFFRNIRDVTRYINSLKFSFGLVKDEVNFVDYLAITAIQVFMPEVYYGIRDNKEVFIGVHNQYYRQIGNYYSHLHRSIEDFDKKICDEIIKKGDRFSEEVLRDFLMILFPKLEYFYYDTSNYTNTSLDTWRRECRICSPEMVDVYFKLALPKGSFSQKEIYEILELGNNSELFSNRLLKLKEEGRIIFFLDRLEDYTVKDIPEENIEPIISSLMDVGDLIIKKGGLFSGTDSSIFRIVHKLLHRFKDQEIRFNIIKRAIEHAKRSLYIIVFEVGELEGECDKHASKESSITDGNLTVNSEQLEELKNLVCRKIETWADNGGLAEHLQMDYILYYWKVWGDIEKVDSFVRNMIKDDIGLINFVSRFLNHNIFYYREGTDTRLKMNLEIIKEFVDLEEIEPRIREIYSSDIEKLDEQQRKAIELLLDTYDGKIKENF